MGADLVTCDIYLSMDWKYSCFLLHVYFMACNICVHNTYLFTNTCITISLPCMFTKWMDFSSLLVVRLYVYACSFNEMLHQTHVLVLHSIKRFTSHLIVYFNEFNYIFYITESINVASSCHTCVCFTAVFICAFKDMYHVHTHTHTLSLPLLKKTLLLCDSYFVYSVKCSECFTHKNKKEKKCKNVPFSQIQIGCFEPPSHSLHTHWSNDIPLSRLTVPSMHDE